MSSGPSLEEVRHFQAQGWKVQRQLTRKATESAGGLVLVHVPLPYKLPLIDGFKMG